MTVKLSIMFLYLTIMKHFYHNGRTESTLKTIKRTWQLKGGEKDLMEFRFGLQIFMYERLKSTGKIDEVRKSVDYTIELNQ